MLNSEWGPHLMCQEQARPTLAGYEHNRKARTMLRQFMKSQFRHRPYTRISRAPNADEQEMTVWDYESYVPPDVSWVRWDPDRDYAHNYNHAYWCDASCSSGCNPTGQDSVVHVACLHEGDEEAPLPQACGVVEERIVKRYVHDQDCTGGCDNRCVERALKDRALAEERGLRYQRAVNRAREADLRTVVVRTRSARA